MARPLCSGPIVLKLGGSLLASGRLGPVFSLITAAVRPLVVVPGGGRFADAVRDAQAEAGFSDPLAHRMALLAMHQTGLLIADRSPRLEPAETLAAIRRVLAAGRIPVWLPYRLASDDPHIPADWSITSDGLAARLAERLRLDRLVLVKSCRADASRGLDRLAAEGIVDAALPALARRARLAVEVIGPGEEQRLSELAAAAPFSGSPQSVPRSGRRRAGAMLGGLAHGEE